MDHYDVKETKAKQNNTHTTLLCVVLLPPLSISSICIHNQCFLNQQLTHTLYISLSLSLLLLIILGKKRDFLRVTNNN